MGYLRRNTTKNANQNNEFRAKTMPEKLILSPHPNNTSDDCYAACQREHCRGYINTTLIIFVTFHNHDKTNLPFNLPKRNGSLRRFGRKKRRRRIRRQWRGRRPWRRKRGYRKKRRRGRRRRNWLCVRRWRRRLLSIRRQKSHNRGTCTRVAKERIRRNHRRRGRRNRQ